MSIDDEALQRELHDWAEASACRLCVLFGSRAGTGPTVKADVDIALDFAEFPGPDTRLDIIGEIQALCGEAMADVVFLHARTDPVLRFEIFRQGLLVYEAERGLFVDGKVRSLMLYEDAIPFRRLLREKLRRGVEETGRRRVT